MRLLIAERSPILRKRLTRLFSDLGYISMVAFVEELNDVPKVATEVKPDVIVIDINFPNHTNLTLLSQLKNDTKHSQIVVLTETTEPRYIAQFEDSGANMVFNTKDDLNTLIAHLNFMDGNVAPAPHV